MSLLVNITWAQIGVNTPNVSSTLTVNGSIAGKYVDISQNTYQIKEDDFNISFSGNAEANFTLPDVTMNDGITGRIYNIKNLSISSDLIIKTSDQQYFRYGSIIYTQINEHRLLPGQYISIVASSKKGWDVYQWDLDKKFSEKTTVIDSFVTTNSVVRLRDISVRADLESSKVLQLQFMTHLSSKEFITRWVTKLSGVNGSAVSKDFASCLETDNNQWVDIYSRGYTINAGFGVPSNDMAVVLIGIDGTNEVYRLTVYVKSAARSKLKKDQITLKIELIK